MTDRDHTKPTALTGASILIVDDHALVSGLLVDGLRAAGFHAVSGFGDSIGDICETITAIAPDICLLDFDLGTLGTALPLVETATEVGARVVILSAHEDRRMVAESVEAGVVGFLNKDTPVPQLVAALRSVARGRILISEPERDDLLAELRRTRAAESARLGPFERMTPREADVLSAICDGKTAADIAEEWVVSVATVRTHIRSILTKLGVKSQVEAVARAQKSGWLNRRSLEGDHRLS